MTIYSIPAPDGKTYQIEGPEGATQEQVQAEVMRQNPHLASSPAAPPPPTPSRPQTAAEQEESAKPDVRSLPPASPGTGSGQDLAGIAESALGAVSNIPYHALAGSENLMRRMTGGDVNAPHSAAVEFFHAPDYSSDQAHAEQALRNVVQPAVDNPVTHALDSGYAKLPDAVRSGIDATSGVANDVLSMLPVAGKAAGLASDIGGAASEAGALARAAGPSSTAKAIATLTPESALPTAQTSRIAAGASNAADLGFRGARDATVGKTLAGDSAGPALQAHNAPVAAFHSAAEANVPQGTGLTYPALATAREAPNAVYDRAASALPTMPLDPRVAPDIEAATAPSGGSQINSGSPDIQARIASLRTQALDPDKQWTGQQVVDTVRDLRRRGFANLASDDVNLPDLGQAQLGIADALDKHLDMNLPANAGTDMDQLLQARKTLAKNYTVEGLLRTNNQDVGEVDINGLARILKKNPDLLDGKLKTMAEFASANPEAVGFPSTLDNFGVGSDLMNVANLHRPVGSTIQALGAGAAGRRMLTGDTSATMDRLNKLFTERPDFSPTPNAVPDFALQPSPGKAFEPLQYGMLAGLGSNPTPPGRPDFELQHTPGSLGDVFAPHQPDMLGGLGPNPDKMNPLSLVPPPGTAFEPHQHDLFNLITQDMSPQDRQSLFDELTKPPKKQ